MPSKFSPPDWLLDLIKLRDERDQSQGPGPIPGTEWHHFYMVYARICMATDPKSSFRTQWENRRRIITSLNSRITYAMTGRPIATQHLKEAWDVYIVEKLIQ